MERHMKSLATFLSPLLFCAALQAAEVRLEVVTPGRSPQDISDVPASVEVVIPEQLEALPGATLDEKLRSLISGVDSTRAAGDVSDGASALTMRGLGSGTQGGRGQGRTLILLDGVPLNNSATGGVNWNDLVIEEIDRIEVFKGPASSLYGSNALAGTINIVTRGPGKGYSLETSYGSRNTFDAAGRAGAVTGALALQVFGRRLQSDGYIHALPEDRDSYTKRAYVLERAAGAKASCDLGESGILRADLSRYSGLRGLGTNYRGTAKGEYRKSVTDLFRLSWSGGGDGLGWALSAFSQKTDQEREEGASVTRLTDISVDRADRGLLSSVSAELAGLRATAGFDWKHGGVDGYDDYRNGKYARDIGEMDSFSPFLQAEKKLLDERLRLVGGLRYDHAKFHDGFSENTNAPGFFSGVLGERSWSRLTPRLSAGYKYGPRSSQYASYAQGFRAGELENMVLTLVKGGGANKWYQKPNPGLGPEKAETLETGFRLNPVPGLYLDPAAYFTAAEGFIYQVETGVTDPSYGKEKMYTNIGKVEIYGLELPVKYISGGISLSASYAQSHSRIISAPGLDIAGSQLTYAPRHIYSAGLSWKAGGTGLFADWTHKSRQFTNDANTASVPGYSVVNAGAERKLSENISLSLRLGNIFNERRQQSPDALAPGRSATGTLRADF